MSREQRLRELSEATLPGAIQDLGEKEMNVSKVISYCEQAYVSQDKREILRQTIEYMEDALGAITQDVELIASEMAGFVDLQSEMLAELTEKTTAVKNAMQVVRAQRGLERLGEECAKEIVDPRVSHQQMVKEEQRPQELPAPARLNLKERFAMFDDVGTPIVREEGVSGGQPLRMSNPGLSGGFGHGTRHMSPRRLEAARLEDTAAQEFDGGGNIPTPAAPPPSVSGNFFS